MNGPKDPWPRVLSLPGAQDGFVGDPTSLARDNIIALFESYNDPRTSKLRTAFIGTIIN